MIFMRQDTAVAHGFRTGDSLAASDKENEHKDKTSNNDFVYGAASACPVTAHTRKTNQRLLPGKGNTPPGGNARIIRSGIPYGIDYVEGKTEKEKRGLLFACYQNHIEGGFRHIQMNWCNNAKFPTGPVKNPGLDPIVGQASDSSQLKTMVTDKNQTYHPFGPFEELVTMKGGEYFFVPSISALKTALVHQ